MKPVYQTEKDDCFRACLASILEIPAEKVSEIPNFMEGVFEDYSKIWVERFAEFCFKKRLNFIFITPNGKNSYLLNSDTFYIAIVSMQNGSFISGWHAVVMQDDRLVHNPNKASQYISMKIHTVKELVVIWENTCKLN